jgi:hypothetical protein
MPLAPRLQTAVGDVMRTSQPPVAGGAADAPARPPLTTRGLQATDINPDDMDDVTMRLFNELKRQLELIEKAEARDLRDVSVREKHARILASLERTMERLAKVEAGRAGARKSKVMNGDGLGGRKALDARIDRIIAIEFEKANHSKTEQSTS